MQPFFLYVEVEPALDRPDVFLAVTKFPAEPEPYRDLLLFPDAEPLRILEVSRLHHKLQCRCVPRLTNIGIHEDRYFYSLGLGPLKTAPRLSPLRSPVPASFWEELNGALKDLHDQGLVHGNLREDVLAITDAGAPLLFDLLAVQQASALSPRTDWEALDALRTRLGK